MLQTNQILTSSIRAELYPFQVEKITRQVNDFILSNKESEECSFEICPKCGAVHPRLTKAGFTAAGKQMLRCHECGKRFVIDHGELTYYSHQSQAKWDDLILETQNGNSMKETAVKINVHETIAFRMRPKYLHSLEQTVYPLCTER